MRRALLLLALCVAAGAAGAQTPKIKGGRPAWAELAGASGSASPSATRG